MSVSLSIAELVPAFPKFRVAVVIAEELVLPPTRPEALHRLIREREEAARTRWQDVELSAIPGVAAWREAYKAFGIKRTSYRSSVERLLKRVKAGEGLPPVNLLVDLYNAVSLTHVLCCGADDLDKVTPPLAFRFSRPTDTFIDMGAVAGEDPNDPPKPREVVYADEQHVLCRRWNWRQDARTVISPATRRALITLQADGVGDVDAAADDLTNLLQTFCGAHTRVGVADAGCPVVSF